MVVHVHDIKTCPEDQERPSGKTKLNGEIQRKRREELAMRMREEKEDDGQLNILAKGEACARGPSLREI